MGDWDSEFQGKDTKAMVCDCFAARFVQAAVGVPRDSNLPETRASHQQFDTSQNRARIQRFFNRRPLPHLSSILRKLHGESKPCNLLEDADRIMGFVENNLRLFLPMVGDYVYRRLQMAPPTRLAHRFPTTIIYKERGRTPQVKKPKAW